MKFKAMLLVVVIIFTALFASCSATEKDEELEPPKKEEAVGTEAQGTEESEPAMKDGTLSMDFVFMGYGKTGNPYNKQFIDDMTEMLNARLSQDMNAMVKFNWLPYESYFESVLTMLASNDGIDALDIQYIGSDICNSLIADNILMDIKESFKVYMPDTYKLLYEKYPDLDDYLLKDGKQYIIPRIEAEPVRYCVITQKEPYKQYAKPISTLGDYGDYLEWLGINKPDLTPGYAKPLDFLYAYITGNGYTSNGYLLYTHLDDAELTYLPIETMSEFREALEMFYEWKDEGYFTIKYGERFQNAVIKGKIASHLMGVYTRSIRDLMVQLPTDIEYEYIVLYPETTMVSTPSFFGLSVLMSGDAAVEVLQFMEAMYNDREYYDLIQYGSEGINYELTDERLTILQSKSETILDWWGSEWFYNYKMERSLWSEQDVYSRFLEKTSFDNTVTYKQWYKKLGIEQKDTMPAEKAEEIERLEKERLEPLLDARYDIYMKFIDSIRNDADVTVDELIEIWDEAATDEIIEIYKLAYELYYK